MNTINHTNGEKTSHFRFDEDEISKSDAEISESSHFCDIIEEKERLQLRLEYIKRSLINDKVIEEQKQILCQLEHIERLLEEFNPDPHHAEKRKNVQSHLEFSKKMESSVVLNTHNKFTSSILKETGNKIQKIISEYSKFYQKHPTFCWILGSAATLTFEYIHETTPVCYVTRRNKGLLCTTHLQVIQEIFSRLYHMYH